MTTGPVAGHLARMTLPMVVGILAVLSISVADTYFVAQLGTNELAALSFTFPVVFCMASIGIGLGAGASSVVSRAVGSGDERRVRRLATDSLILALLIVGGLATLGLLTIEPLFRLLGALAQITGRRSYKVGLCFDLPECDFPSIQAHAVSTRTNRKRPGNRLIDPACLHLATDDVGDDDRKGRTTVGKIPGPVDGIDNPDRVIP